MLGRVSVWWCGGWVWVVWWWWICVLGFGSESGLGVGCVFCASRNEVIVIVTVTVTVKVFGSAMCALRARGPCGLFLGACSVLALCRICLYAICLGATLIVSVSVWSGPRLHYRVFSCVGVHLCFGLDAGEISGSSNHLPLFLRASSYAYPHPCRDLVVCLILLRIGQCRFLMAPTVPGCLRCRHRIGLAPVHPLALPSVVSPDPSS